MVTARPNFQDSIHVGFVSGLKKFTEYFTSVLCFTTPGDGPRSSPQLVRTLEDGRHPSPLQPLPRPPTRGQAQGGLVFSPILGALGHPGLSCRRWSLSGSNWPWVGWGSSWGTVPGPVGHLSFSDILDTSLKVSWQEPGEKNGILTGGHRAVTGLGEEKVP